MVGIEKMLHFLPIFQGDTSLAQYLSEEAYSDITQMRIWNSDFLVSFNHELVLSA